MDLLIILGLTILIFGLLGLHDPRRTESQFYANDSIERETFDD